MLSVALAVLMVLTPTHAVDVQPGAVVFTLDADQVQYATLFIESGGREWTEMPSAGNAQYSVVWDTTELPPFAEAAYRWSGTREDMSGFEVGGTVTLADMSQAWQRADGDRATVWWYGQPVEYGLRALAAAEAQMARLDALPGDLARARVVIYQSQADYGSEALRSGVALSHDTTVVWPSCGDGYLFTTTIPHEILHLKTKGYRERMPLWFAEGLAVWSEPRSHADELALARAGTPLSWDEMQRQAWTDVTGQQRWYAQAYALVEYIDREKHLQDLLAYIAATPNAGFEDAARWIVGLNSAQIMQEWRIAQGLEPRPRTRVSPDVVRCGVIAGHLVALAGLTWWRMRLRVVDAKQ